MLAVLALCSGLARAEPQEYDIGIPRVQTTGIGVGGTVGSTTGLSVAWHPEGPNAAQAGFGWNFRDGRLDTSADYLRTFLVVRPNARMHVPLYAGLGVGVSTLPPGSKPTLFQRVTGVPIGTGISARAPIGASLFFENAPVEVFGQVVPSVRVLPLPSVRADVMVGARYYF